MAVLKQQPTSGAVDIYIKERNGGREIRIPWLPDKITHKLGDTMTAEYDILNKGTVAVPTGSGLATVAWESQFPGSRESKYPILRGTWAHPMTYHVILRDWMTKGTPLNIMVTSYPINLDVFLEEYEAVPTGGFGGMEYSVTFKEDREIIITSKTETKATQTSEQKRSAPETTAYTIKKGDCLWSIAQQHLGAGSRWREIYNANKDIIESTAKKYGRSSSNDGWWIYPGVTIQIPK